MDARLLPTEFELGESSLRVASDIKSAITRVYQYTPSEDSTKKPSMVVVGMKEAMTKFSLRTVGSKTYGSIPTFNVMAMACVDYEANLHKIINVRAVFSGMPIGLFLKGQKLKYNEDPTSITTAELIILQMIKSWNAWINNKQLFSKELVSKLVTNAFVFVSTRNAGTQGPFEGITDIIPASTSSAASDTASSTPATSDPSDATSASSSTPTTSAASSSTPTAPTTSASSSSDATSAPSDTESYQSRINARAECVLAFSESNHVVTPFTRDVWKWLSSV